MPVPLPLKWKQFFYKWIMLFGKKRKVEDKEMKEAIEPVFNIEVTDIDGNRFRMDRFRGKKILIVNVASECGFTPQYRNLQELYSQYGDRLYILGFPANDFGGQEPGNEQQIKFFCTENYQVTFPLFSKIKVTGTNAHDLYIWLCDPARNGWNSAEPTWNFCKYLLDEKGNLLRYYSQQVNPFDEDILSQLVR
jgi:glutathione peroxidase